MSSKDSIYEVLKICKGCTIRFLPILSGYKITPQMYKYVTSFELIDIQKHDILIRLNLKGILSKQESSATFHQNLYKYGELDNNICLEPKHHGYNYILIENGCKHLKRKSRLKNIE